MFSSFPPLHQGARRALPAPTFWTVVGLALAVRFVVVGGLLWPIHWSDQGLDYGSELGSIARNLHEGRGFSSPFERGSEPTAWLAPLVPMLWAAVFQVFGLFTQPALNALLFLQLLAGALAAGLYVRIASWSLERAGARGPALPWLVALTVILWPESIARQTDLWYSAFQDLALAWMFLRGLRWIEAPSPRTALRLGIAAGVLASINPGPLVLLGGLLGGILLRRGRRWGSDLRSIALAVGVCALILTPWTLRNFLVLGHFIPLRSNLGVELLQGNGPRATVSQQRDSQHPAIDPIERERYRRLGEHEYSRTAKAEALEHIRQDPGAFARRTLQRVTCFWIGDILDRWTWEPRPPWWEAGPLSIARRLIKVGCNWAPLILVLVGLSWGRGRRVPGLSAYVWLLVLLPLPYYLTHVHQAYSYTVRPYLLLLALLLLVLREPARKPEAPKLDELLLAPDREQVPVP